MGCWNYQVFCDDTALDALDELLESDEPAEDLERYLNRAIMAAAGYLDYDACQYGLVAAAVVDAVQNGLDWSLLTDITYTDEDDYVEFFELIKDCDLRSLTEKAADVLLLAMGESSELRELWADNAELCPHWLDNITQIRERLLSGE